MENTEIKKIPNVSSSPHFRSKLTEQRERIIKMPCIWKYRAAHMLLKTIG